MFSYADVTASRPDHLTGLLDRGDLGTQAGTVLPLESVRRAQGMIAGARHKRGKIVLSVAKGR